MPAVATARGRDPVDAIASGRDRDDVVVGGRDPVDAEAASVRSRRVAFYFSLIGSRFNVRAS